jgi:hypothetical protein
MKKLFSFFLVSFILFISFPYLKADEIKVGKITSGFQTVQNPDWASDILVSPQEPLGKISGIARPDGTAFIMIPDTTSVPGFCLLIYKSTDFGDTWTRQPNAITSSSIVTKTKLILTGADSIYCLFQIGNGLFLWNIETNNFNENTNAPIRDFDAAATSAGTVFLVTDVFGTNQIRRFSTLDGGVSYVQNGTLITSAGAHPKASKSATGDSIIVNYYGPVLEDTATSIIRSAIYRESTPGTFLSSNFVNVTPAGTVKNEFLTVVNSGIVWFLYTEGTTGAIDIKGYLSNNGGVNYPTQFDVAVNPNLDEYWFNAKPFIGFGGGIDLAFYSDSLGGTPGNDVDKIIYTSAILANPTSFSSGERISEHYPQWSPNGYSPQVIEFYDGNADVGITWVGVDAGTRKVYFDRLSNMTGINPASNEIPDAYALSQNYPNPFNPATKINFSIPKDGFVSLKVFDMLGREVATLVNGKISTGSYSVDFDGSRFSSGTYFYRLESEGFSDVKKMILVK